jgi:hypothetical protein
MIAKVLLGIGILALCVGMVYGIYMAYWGVWND